MAASLGFAFSHASLDAKVSGSDQAGSPTTTLADHGERTKFGVQKSPVVPIVPGRIRGL